MERKLKTCDNAKTVMILVIILYHSMALWLRGGWFNIKPSEANMTITFLAEWFNSFHIYVFTFVSGYIFSYLRIEKNKYNSFSDLAKKKAIRLMVPYMCVSIFWCIPYDIIYFDIETREIINKYILAASPAQLWYVIMLFGVFILCHFFVEKIEASGLFQCIICCLGVYYLGTIIGILLELPFQIANIIKFSSIFILGMKYRICKLKINNSFIVNIAVNLIIFIFYFQISGKNNINCKLISMAVLPFLNFSGVAMVWSGIDKLNNLKIWDNKIVSFFRNNSFTIYLFHQQIIYWCITQFNGKVTSFLLVFINFTVSTLLSAIICIVLNRFKVTRLLIGKT